MLINPEKVLDSTPRQCLELGGKLDRSAYAFAVERRGAAAVGVVSEGGGEGGSGYSDHRSR